MKAKRALTLALAAVTAFSMGAFLPPVEVKAADQETATQETVDMYRMYNKSSGEHFYTKDVKERNDLILAGWGYEGVGWEAPKTSNTPVYRLYNRNTGDHHYTMDASEKDYLVSKGWKYENIGWYSDDAKAVPLYRQYNPKAKAGSHNYTTDAGERDGLVKIGWQDEKVGWYAVKGGDRTITDEEKLNDEQYQLDILAQGVLRFNSYRYASYVYNVMFALTQEYFPFDGVPTEEVQEPGNVNYETYRVKPEYVDALARVVFSKNPTMQGKTYDLKSELGNYTGSTPEEDSYSDGYEEASDTYVFHRYDFMILSEFRSLSIKDNGEVTILFTQYDPDLTNMQEHPQIASVTFAPGDSSNPISPYVVTGYSVGN